MAPKIELEADHLRDKARKDLLGLLEGVSNAAVVELPVASNVDLPLGSRQEESGDWKGLDWTRRALCQVLNFARVRR